MDVLVGVLGACFLVSVLSAALLLAALLALVPILGAFGVPALWVGLLGELWTRTGGGSQGRTLLAAMPPLALVLWCLPAGAEGVVGAAIVGLVWWGVGLRVLQHEPCLPQTLVDVVDLAPDPRWRLAWWSLASILVGLIWAHWSMFPLALAALAVGCVRARRTLVVLPRGVRVIERLPWATHEHWVEADRVWCEPLRTWWGGRVLVGRGLTVRTGEVPPDDWLWQVSAHARRAARHTVAVPGRNALRRLVAHGQG